MSNIENEIKILLNLFNIAKFDILISKAKKLIKKAPEYLILYKTTTFQLSYLIIRYQTNDRFYSL